MKKKPVKYPAKHGNVANRKMLRALSIPGLLRPDYIRDKLFCFLWKYFLDSWEFYEQAEMPTLFLDGFSHAGWQQSTNQYKQKHGCCCCELLQYVHIGPLFSRAHGLVKRSACPLGSSSGLGDGAEWCLTALPPCRARLQQRPQYAESQSLGSFRAFLGFP